MTRGILGAAGLAGMLVIAPLAGAAQSSAGTVTLGMLTCRLTQDTNVVVFSKERFDCVYQEAGGGRGHYLGEISKIGADLQLKSDQMLKWAVLAPSSISGPDVIEGRYVGGSAEATALAGLGARVLVGGSRNQITLQPVSVSGQTGIGASATLDALRLTYRPG